MTTLYDNNGNAVVIEHAIDVKAALETGKYVLDAPWEAEEKKRASKPKPVASDDDVAEEVEVESTGTEKQPSTKKSYDNEPKKKKFSFVDEDKDANK